MVNLVTQFMHKKREGKRDSRLQVKSIYLEKIFHWLQILKYFEVLTRFSFVWHFDLSFCFFFFLFFFCFFLISFLSVILGKYHSSSGPKTESEEETTGQILQHEKSTAGLFCRLKTRHGSQASHLQLTKDVLGIVASLGKVVDENLNRLIDNVFYLFLHLSLVILWFLYWLVSGCFFLFIIN